MRSEFRIKARAAPPKEAYTTHQVTRMFQVKKLRYTKPSNFSRSLAERGEAETVSSRIIKGTNAKKMQIVKCQYQEIESKSADNKLRNRGEVLLFISG